MENRICFYIYEDQDYQIGTHRYRSVRWGSTAVSTSDYDTIDFFRAGPLSQDPYPYYEYLREHGPMWRASRITAWS